MTPANKILTDRDHCNKFLQIFSDLDPAIGCLNDVPPPPTPQSQEPPVKNGVCNYHTLSQHKLVSPQTDGSGKQRYDRLRNTGDSWERWDQRGRYSWHTDGSCEQWWDHLQNTGGFWKHWEQERWGTEGRGGSGGATTVQGGSGPTPIASQPHQQNVQQSTARRWATS